MKVRAGSSCLGGECRTDHPKLAGRCSIIEYEQHGEDRAKYGARRLLPTLAKDLKQKGYSGAVAQQPQELSVCARTRSRKGQAVPAAFGSDEDSAPNLLRSLLGNARGRNRQRLLLASLFPSLVTRINDALPWRNGALPRQSVARTFSWTHFVELLRIDSPLRRAFYEIESLKSRWGSRELRRQMETMLYERIGLSKDKDAVLALADEGLLVQSPATIVRRSVHLEFMGLSPQSSYSESDLEQSAPQSSASASFMNSVATGLFRGAAASNYRRWAASLSRSAILSSRTSVV